MAFCDLAATSPEKGKGFSANVLNELRKVEALVHVVRGFDNPALSDAPDLLRDTASFESELVLADLIVAEKRLERLRKEGAKSREREPAGADSGAPRNGQPPARTEDPRRRRLEAARGLRVFVA